MTIVMPEAPRVIHGDNRRTDSVSVYVAFLVLG